MNEEGKPMHKSDGTAIWFEEVRNNSASIRCGGCTSLRTQQRICGLGRGTRTIT